MLFEDPAIYATSYRSFSHPSSNIFHSVVGDVAFPDILGETNISMDDLHQDNVSKQYYALGTSSMGGELPAASSAPGYESHQALGSFSSADIPRTSYMSAPLSSAPDVLIHPPTLPFLSSQYNPHGEYRSTSASPATSAGGFEGSGSGLSGSEPGSLGNSPYNPPIGVEEHLRSFAMMEPGVSFAGIDPSLVSISTPVEPMSAGSPYGGSPNWNPMHSPPQMTSNPSSPDFRRQPSGRLSPVGHPYGRQFPYPQRRPSTGSVHSRASMGSPSLNTLDHDDIYAASNDMVRYAPSRSPSQRSNASIRRSPDSATGNGKDTKDTLCTECNKCFRDLRAHQLTHMLERPEKCPIATCEYSKKGFARKYDCQRHTLTHYKGTMVCGFCPGSGSAMEKSFNRADVFKRHLMAVHNVEQTPPNGRQKKTSSKGKGPQTEDYNDTYASGKCSTCDITFATAQQFYEHLDDCVLSKVVEEEPAAAANERNLAQIKLEELEEDYALEPRMDDEDEDEEDEFGEVDEMEDDEDKDETYVGTSSKQNKRRALNTRSKSKTLKRSGTGSSR